MNVFVKKEYKQGNMKWKNLKLCAMNFKKRKTIHYTPWGKKGPLFERQLDRLLCYKQFIWPAIKYENINTYTK